MITYQEKMISKLRTNSHQFRSEIDKCIFMETSWEKKICNLCNLKEIENKVHFLLRFHLYNNITCAYIDICNPNLIHEILNQDNQTKFEDFIVSLNSHRNNCLN